MHLIICLVTASLAVPHQFLARPNLLMKNGRNETSTRIYYIIYLFRIAATSVSMLTSRAA